MNNLANQQALKTAVHSKFRGHDKLYSKYQIRYPQSAEREYKRIALSYMKLVKETITDHMPELMKAVQRERLSSKRLDDDFNFQQFLDILIMKMQDDLFQKTALQGLKEKLQSLANLNKKATIREWKKAVQATLGIDILEDYYNGELFEQLIRQWVETNVNLIQSISQESLGKMKDVVLVNFHRGHSYTEIAKEIQKAYGVEKRKAIFLACDQIGKLNSQLTQYQQEDAGIEEYIWSTSGDSRVRKTHKALDGTKQNWKKPPDVGNGHHCHPGEDYRCRCVALPVFKEEGMDLPWYPKEKDSPQ